MSNFCSYCGSLIIGERCGSCGAPLSVSSKSIKFIDLRQAIEIEINKACESILNFKRGGIRL